MNLNWMLERAARTFPEKEAIVSDLQTLSYRELLDTTKRAAQVFRDLGVAPGDRVGVMTYNTPAFIIAAFGLWRAGAALVPINHKFTATEVKYVAEHASLGLIVGDADFEAQITKGAPNARLLTTTDDASGEFDTLVAAAKPWDGVEVTGDMIAQVLYTSGTTSSPKGCLHTHAGLSGVPAYTTAAVGLRREDRFLIAMPIWHASPLNNWMLSMVYLAGTIVLLKEYHPVHFLATVEKHRATAFFGAPIAYLAPLKVLPTIDKQLSDFDLTSMRLWAYGGAPMGAQTVQMLQQAYNTDNFYQVYGMSEMGPVGSALYPEEQVQKAGAIGAGGMPGVDIRVVKEDGEPASAGEVGEIWIRSSTRMQGYLNNPEATADVFDGDWYLSGDLARIDEDGYLTIVDRLKDVVITGGENVYSPEVEEALRQHPEIIDAAAVGRPHEEWGETLVAVIEATEAGASLTIEEVREFLSTQLAKYKMPRELVFSAQLPRNPSGKIMKHVLRAELTA
ncbi:class I adenylate-forming enzyme family protein [Leucobacter chinensis]|uniref:class I adenylate-forming enzyme family protein n=1 Tax=Leucobacter chinensis TaxID=2851010 RepID=UPI00350F5135